MTHINKSALVPYSAEQMYALVDDIPAYPEFLPWCQSAEELHRSDTEVEGSLFISHSGLKKSFTTRNTLDKPGSITMQLVEGPFKHLKGVWQFQALGEEGCKVTLDMDFEFSSKIMGMTFGPIFSHMANSLVDAFVQRAQQCYGN
ncbi:MAG: type II toxin-antitoxin system RatA family toxin [Gammaproteobacteria bacterium]